MQGTRRLSLERPGPSPPKHQNDKLHMLIYSQYHLMRQKG